MMLIPMNRIEKLVKICAEYKQDLLTGYEGKLMASLSYQQLEECSKEHTQQLNNFLKDDCPWLGNSNVVTVQINHYGVDVYLLWH